MEHQAEREAGVIPIPPKRLAELNEIELQVNSRLNKADVLIAQADALRQGAQALQNNAELGRRYFLEEVCGIDLDAEKWTPDLSRGRYVREGARLPENRPEHEIKPLSANGAGQPAAAVPVPLLPRRERRAQKKAKP